MSGSTEIAGEAGRSGLDVDESSPRVDPEVMAIYARTARHYERLNAVASLGTSTWYRRRTVLSLGLAPDARLVDVGCGTGMLALAAQRYLPDSPSIVAVDPCPEMRAVASKLGVRDVRAGDFEHIPVEDGAHDAVVSGFALRYARDLPAALAEVRRTLRPGGRTVLLEMVCPPPGSRRRIVGGLVRGLGAPVLGLLCGSRDVRRLMEHFWESVSSFASPGQVVRALESAGFHEAEYRHAGGLLGEFRARRPVDS